MNNDSCSREEKFGGSDGATQCDPMRGRAKVRECFRRGFDCPDEISVCVFYETLLTYGQVVFGSATVSVTNSTETFFY
jgi:hypothetical protein